MLRSFIARSQPLLSHLRWRAAAKPWILPSRAYATEDGTARRDGADRTTATAAAANLRRHLYVVLKEMNTSHSGAHSIYKLDFDDLHGAGDENASAMDEAPRRLPEPALRLGVSLVSTFEALGDNIVITGHSDTISRDGAFFLTLVYDTKKGKLDGGSPPYDPEPWWPRGSYQAAPVGGDKLWALDATDNTPGYLSPLPLDATGYNNRVKSHAVHPDGRTIFATSSFTFSLDTEGCRSARRGDWHLPFHGRGYYNGDLDAWVGIRVADGADGGSKGHPYLCSCDVPKLVDAEGPVQEPAWKMCDEELTFLKTPVSLGSRTLIHTGRGRFCLVEVVPATVAKEGGEPSCPTDDESIECLLHVTMFRAKHCKNSDLVVTPCRRGRSYC
ncbi:hypothetical protein VPH35_101938 [Triticum aestivum]